MINVLKANLEYLGRKNLILILLIYVALLSKTLFHMLINEFDEFFIHVE